MRSTSSAFAVSMTMGIAEVVESDLSTRQTSSPDIPGNIKSSTIKLGRFSLTAASAVGPSCALDTS